jgi:hypothetical protein
MITTFRIIVSKKTGLFTKILVAMNKEGYKIVKHCFTQSQKPPAIYIDIESGSPVCLEKLLNLKQQFPDIQAIEQEKVILSPEDKDLSREIASDSPTNDHDVIKTYRGQVVDASSDKPRRHPINNEHVYRGQKNTDAELDASKKGNGHTKNKPKLYRGQHIG